MQHEKGATQLAAADALDTFLSVGRSGGAGRAAMCNTVIGVNKRSPEAGTARGGGDAMDSFIEGYMKRCGAIPR